MNKADLESWLHAAESPQAGTERSAVDSTVPEGRCPGQTPPQAGTERSAVPGSSDTSGLADLWAPDAAASPALDIARILLDSGHISPAIDNQARTLLKQTPGKRLADILIDLGTDDVAVQTAVAQSAGIPFERIDPLAVSDALVHRLGIDYCKANGILPLRDTGSRIVVGVTDPRRLFIIDELRHRLSKPVKVVLVTASDIAAIIDARTESAAESSSDLSVDEIIKDIEEDDVEVVEDKAEDVDLERQAAESPVIRFVNYVIADAVKAGASDIHIEPQEKKLRVRYRIDGILFEMMSPPHSMHAAIISRLKIMANLDISERRLPQDGRVRAIIHGRKLDLRLSTLPTGHGEKAVMRILDSRSVQITLEQLGMPEETLLMWKHQIDQPHGIILVTGPTGSGKTTTLYSSLNQMDRNSMNISTVEDPIEYHLGGINQVQVHERIGMSFSAALRSLLRQDPDVVMVGEIRDEETARIAVQAALTGHLVLSTLHTNDAPSSITRLINIGVEPYLIGAAVNAVLAQRLVRRICEHCKQPQTITQEAADHLALHGITIGEVFHGTGCPKCHQTGYHGRVGLYELLVLDDMTRDAIAARPNVTEFRRLCIERGMNTLRIDGFKKVVQGRTTVEEVLRVTQSTI
jgi:type IV pilus assembly protein PilB